MGEAVQSDELNNSRDPKWRIPKSEMPGRLTLG